MSREEYCELKGSRALSLYICCDHCSYVQVCWWPPRDVHRSRKAGAAASPASMMNVNHHGHLLLPPLSMDAQGGVFKNGDEKATRPPRQRRRKARPECGIDVDVEGRKRRLSDEQATLLELSFRRERKLETARKVRLAAEAGLEPKQVAVWFQNRRARHKSKLLEEELRRLRAARDAAVVEKSLLETQVLDLKERLRVSEEELKKLSAGAPRTAAVAAGSPSSSSFSTNTNCPLAMAGQFRQGEDDDDLYCVPSDYSYRLSMMEWVNIYGLM